MTSTKSVSSGTVFKALIELGKQKSSTQGTKLNGTELKQALDAFSWNDGNISKTEVIAARKEFTALQKSNNLSSDGSQAFDDWFKSAGTGSDGGFSYQRTSDVLQALEGQFRFNADSQKGATFTKAEAQTLVGLLGNPPTPGRIADITELLANVKSTGKSKDAQTVLAGWLKEHPLATPAQPLGKQLAAATQGMLWPSETDRPLYPIDLGKAPGPTANVENAARKALNEPASAHLEVRDFDQVFSQLTTVNDPNDPGDVKRAADFTKLEGVLKNNLSDLHVIRAGDTDIDVYAVGKDKTGKWVGVMSGVVET